MQHDLLPLKCKATIHIVGNTLKRLFLLMIVIGCIGCLPANTDQSATELRVTDLRQTRTSNLKKYPNLEVLDLRAVDVSEELFGELSASHPEYSILWRVPIGTASFDNTASALTLPSDTTIEDINRLVYFPQLRQVDATQCTITKALLDATDAYSDILFTWAVADVPISAQTKELDLSNRTIENPATLQLLLEHYPDISEVDLSNAIISESSLAALYARHGQAELIRNVDIAGKTVSYWAESIDLTGTPSTETASLVETLSTLPLLKTVDLTGQPFEFSDMDALKAACPDVTFYFTFQVFSQVVDSRTETLDLSNLKFSTPDDVSLQLQYLANLKEVNMCDCGLTNEQMEQLIDAFPNVKFIWYIRIGGWKIRTDITAFSKGQRKKFPNGMGEFLADGKTNFYSEDLEPLKYCKDLVFLDLGHGNRITDLSILKNFPKLRGLVLSMNKITDITPIASLKELESLEIYQNYILDVSPLAELPNLKYLNLSRNSFTDVTPLMGMKQLKKLWLVHNDQISSDAKLALAAALPDCEVRFYGNSSGSAGWRDNELYFEYQKAFNLPTKP